MRGPDSDELARPGDGRNIDEGLGVLSGEGAQQQVRRRGEAPQPQPRAPGAGPDYYGLPVLQEPTWIWTIPTYFFVGGAAGAASALGASLRLLGGPKLARLDRRCQALATAGELLSAGLLISDLGRPERFLNMLRVIRITSPMSVGAWVLTASGACNSLALLLGRRPGTLGRLAGLAGLPLGVTLAGYTGVLLANTAVPVWQAAHRALPPLFMASGVSAATSALELLESTPAERRTLWLYGTAGRLAVLAATAAVERQVGRHPEVARPLRSGVSGGLWTAARAMTATGLGLSLLPGRSRRTARLASLLGLGGSLAMRFALLLAGRRSARNPQATFQGQRAGLGAAELEPAAGPPRRSVRLPVLRG